FSVGWNLVVVGLSLDCWAAWREGRRGALVAWLAAACVLPMFTVTVQGFLGFGINALLVVVCLVLTFVRPRLTWLPIGLVIGFLGVSTYVTYMRDRGEIRDVVWTGAPVEERIAQVFETLTDPEWFDPYNRAHLERIDARLNQNVLVGAAVRYLELQNNPFAYGQTLWDAAIALVPRALWPAKPVSAGSPDIVSRYTGLVFSESTSVGIGQVMEFYVNFGRLGVVVGFLTLGTILALIDLGAYQRL